MDTIHRLYVRRHGSHWDLVANLGKLADLASFALHFPGHRWEVRNEKNEVLLEGRTPPRIKRETTS